MVKKKLNGQPPTVQKQQQANLLIVYHCTDNPPPPCPSIGSELQKQGVLEQEQGGTMS